MTPQEALELLDQATQALNANRAVHNKIIEAITVLKNVIKE